MFDANGHKCLPLLSCKYGHAYVSSSSVGSFVVVFSHTKESQTNKQNQVKILCDTHPPFIPIGGSSSFSMGSFHHLQYLCIQITPTFNGCESTITTSTSMASTRVLRLSFSVCNESWIHTISQIWMLNVVISFLGISSKASRLFFFFMPLS